MVSFLDVLQGIQNTTESRSPFVQTLAQFPKAVANWVNVWPTSQSNHDIIRCSGAYFMCPREFVLNYWKPSGSKTFGFVEQMRAGIGTYLHSYLQDVILGPLGILYGEWKCGDGNPHHIGYHPFSIEGLEYYQKFNQEVLWQYVEQEVWDGHYRMKGHLDGLVDKDRMKKFVELINLGNCDWKTIIIEVAKVPESTLDLLEIKTTSSMGFERIQSSRDLPDYYKMQAAAYQKLTGKFETIFWYFERNDCTSRLFSYEFEENWWKEAARKATIVWESIRDEVLPDSMMKCLTSKDSRAKTCPHSEGCWTKNTFKQYIQKCKEEQLGREWLNLQAWQPSLEDAI